MPRAALWTGEMDRSAHFTSHTLIGKITVANVFDGGKHKLLSIQAGKQIIQPIKYSCKKLYNKKMNYLIIKDYFTKFYEQFGLFHWILWTI